MERKNLLAFKFHKVKLSAFRNDMLRAKPPKWRVQWSEPQKLQECTAYGEMPSCTDEDIIAYQ
jgi:hypothetical protein